MTRRKAGIAGALNALGALRSLAVIAATVGAVFWLGIAIVFGVLPVGTGLTDRLRGVVAGDFMYFYSAGALAVRGHAEKVYDVEAMTAVARHDLGPEAPDLVWPYPPTMSVLLTPIGALRPRAAFVAWIGVSVLALLTLGRLALGSWRLSPIALLFPASALALFTGQISPVLGLSLGVEFLFLDRSPRVAGAALALVALKPHFAVVPGLVTLTKSRRRALAAAIATGGCLIVASLVLFGVQPWKSFVEDVLRHAQVLDRETPLTRFISVFAAAHTYGASLWTALAIHVAVAIPVVLLALHVWSTAARASLRALGLIGATLLLTPYALDYDLVFLLLPWCLMIREARADPGAARPLLWLWLTVTCLAPLSYMIPLFTGRSVAAPLLIVIVGLAWRLRHSDAGSTTA